jgi:hypothetical protein
MLDYEEKKLSVFSRTTLPTRFIISWRRSKALSFKFVAVFGNISQMLRKTLLLMHIKVVSLAYLSFSVADLLGSCY